MEPQADEPAQQQNIQPVSHRRRRKTWPVVAIVAVTVIAVAIAVTVFIRDNMSGEDQEAKDACEKFVGELLTAPSSAQYTHTYTNLAGGNWTVKGNVEAADSFGVMLRSEFRCVVDGETWELVLLRIDE